RADRLVHDAPPRSEIARIILQQPVAAQDLFGPAVHVLSLLELLRRPGLLAPVHAGQGLQEPTHRGGTRTPARGRPQPLQQDTPAAVDDPPPDRLGVHFPSAPAW